MKLYCSFFLVLFLTGSVSMKAPPDTLWTKIFGGDNQNGCSNNPGDVGRVVEITDDQGYTISGWTNSFGLENTDVWIINTDANGNETWSHAITINEDADDAVYDMKQTEDGGFILTGITDIVYCSGGHGGRWACGGKILLVRTNEIGDTLWTHKYDEGGVGWSEGKSIQETKDGGFIVVGRVDTEENGSDVWLSKTDNKGALLWTQIFASDGYDEGLSVHQTDDGGFILTGMTQPQNEESQKAWLIRTNELGDTLWTQKYLMGDWTVGKTVLQMDDGGFLIAGAAESWSDNIMGKPLMPPLLEKYLTITYDDKTIFSPGSKTDHLDVADLYTELEKELNLTEKTNSFKEHLKSLVYEKKIIESRDAILIRTNELGDILWTGIYGGSGWDDIHTVSTVEDGGFILAGEKFVEGHDSQDIWLVRTNEIGDTLWTTTVGDSATEIAYDVKQTFDNGYIVTGSKHNREIDVDQTWLIRYGKEITGLTSADDHLITNFILEQNYPNPFNLTTKITYQLPINEYIDLSIYNLLGHKVLTLVSEKQNVGYHTVEWNARQISSGVYYYQLTAGKFRDVKKMILVK